MIYIYINKIHVLKFIQPKHPSLFDDKGFLRLFIIPTKGPYYAPGIMQSVCLSDRMKFHVKPFLKKLRQMFTTLRRHLECMVRLACFKVKDHMTQVISCPLCNS